MSLITVTATVTDAGGHVGTASASATITDPVPSEAEIATWGQTTTTVTSNTTYSSTSGQVVNGVHFDGARVSFTGTDITLNDCVITGDTSGSPLVSVTNANARRIVLNRCVLRPKTPGNRNAIQGQNFILNDCLIEKTTDGVSVAKSGYTAAQINWPTGVELHRVVIRKLARWTGAAPGTSTPPTRSPTTTGSSKPADPGRCSIGS